MKKLFKRIFNPDGNTMNSEDQDAVDYLILNKALEVAGVDSATGELLYSFTPKIKEVMPELYKEHMNHVNSEMMQLWENGLININFLEDNPTVTLTPKAFDKEALSKLPDNIRWGIEEIKRLLKQRNF